MDAKLISEIFTNSPWGHTEEVRVYSTDRGEITVSCRYTIGDTDRFERWGEIQEEFRVKLEQAYREMFDYVPE